MKGIKYIAATLILLFVASGSIAQDEGWWSPEFVKETLHYKLTYEEYDGKLDKASSAKLLDMADSLGLTNREKPFGCYSSRGSVSLRKYLDEENGKKPEYNPTNLKRLAMCSVIYDELKLRLGNEITF